MARYLVLAAPSADIANGEVPSQIHLLSGGIAKPTSFGNVLVAAADAAALLAAGWTTQAAGGDDFLSSILSVTATVNGVQVQAWKPSGPAGGYDGSAI
jgi:hypothetical protein